MYYLSFTSRTNSSFYVSFSSRTIWKSLLEYIYIQTLRLFVAFKYLNGHGLQSFFDNILGLYKKYSLISFRSMWKKSLPSSFVYIPLQYDPEASSLIDCQGAIVEAHTLVQDAANFFPSDITILVKKSKQNLSTGRIVSTLFSRTPNVYFQRSTQ